MEPKKKHTSVVTKAKDVSIDSLVNKSAQTDYNKTFQRVTGAADQKLRQATAAAEPLISQKSRKYYAECPKSQLFPFGLDNLDFPFGLDNLASSSHPLSPAGQSMP